MHKPLHNAVKRRYTWLFVSTYCFSIGSRISKVVTQIVDAQYVLRILRFACWAMIEDQQPGGMCWREIIRCVFTEGMYIHPT